MRYLVLAALFLAVPALAADKKSSAGKLPLVFQDDFSKGAGHWAPSDPGAWKVIDTKEGKAYSQFKQSSYKPPFRSPFNFALVKDLVVSDCVLEGKCQSTTKDYPHRDMCLVFGYQDPAHFYYVHLGKRTDDHANQIFIVNGAPRVKISTKTTPGTPWDDGWHTVRVVRRVEDGSIAIYFDDMKTSVMTANDKAFTWGQVGVGSFDDTGNWTDIKVYGTKTTRRPSARRTPSP
jgi:hypothetical protein